MVKWAKIFGILEGGNVSLKLSRSDYLIFYLLLSQILNWSSSQESRLILKVLMLTTGISYDSSNTVEYPEAQHNKNGND